MSEWPLVNVPVARLSASGVGRPWVAEIEGDSRDRHSGYLKFVHGSKRGKNHLVYRLDPAKTYVRQEPYWKQSGDDTPLAEDDQIGVQRFVFCVSPRGDIVDLEPLLPGEWVGKAMTGA